MSDNSNMFQTPKPTKSIGSFKHVGSSSPFVIPPSPCMKRLGFGTGVNVFLIERFSPLKGCYKSPWAVKKVSSKLKGNPEFSKRLETEAKVLKSLSHPHIIGYRSYMKSSDDTACLVMESSQRSLCDIVEDHADNALGPIPSNKILKVVKCIASALSYLHHACHLLHGDLKSANILIKGDFEVIKLCDFGVSLRLNENLDAVNGDEYVGTECWSPPEAIKGLNISNKSDMFSFGLVLWEMMSLSVPHLDKLECEASEDSSFGDDQITELEKLKEQEFLQHLGTRPDLPDNINIECQDYGTILEIFYACTEEAPNARPSAKTLMDTYFSQ